MPLKGEATGVGEDYKIFIAYETTTGVAYAQNLKLAVERSDESLRTFFAPVDLYATEPISNIINQYLSKCNFFIPIFTQNAHNSINMKEEIEYVLSNIEKYQLIICQKTNYADKYIPREFNSYKKIKFNEPSDLAGEVVYELDKLINKKKKRNFGLNDLERMGIQRIFEQRRKCPELDECIKKEIAKSTKLKIMANTSRDFFGDSNTKFSKDIKTFLEKMKKDGTEDTIQLILLDPFSEAAFDRYTIEYFRNPPRDHDEVLNKYFDSTFFRDITNVIKWYADNSQYHGLISLKFSSLTPQMFFLETENYSFIELYHNSPLDRADITPEGDDSGAICIAGYLPVFMIKNNKTFGQLMSGHFHFAWRKAKKWNNNDTEIKKFLEDPKTYRYHHLITELYEKSKIFQKR